MSQDRQLIKILIVVFFLVALVAGYYLWQSSLQAEAPIVNYGQPVTPPIDITNPDTLLPN